MKVKYIGKVSDPLYFIEGKTYEKTGESMGMWRVIDETGEDYLYSPKIFEVVEEDAVDAFKTRRDARLQKRMDADEDDNNNNGGASGGHGNTKLPFGLCQREGIAIDPSWGPKDAWDALAGKGYSASEVYKELKDTGKVAPKTKPAKEMSSAELKKAFKDIKSYKDVQKELEELNAEHKKLSEELDYISGKGMEKADADIERYQKEMDAMLGVYPLETMVPSQRQRYELYKGWKEEAEARKRRYTEEIPKKVERKNALVSRITELENGDAKKKSEDAVKAVLKDSQYAKRVMDYRGVEEDTREVRRRFEDVSSQIEATESMLRRTREWEKENEESGGTMGDFIRHRIDGYENTLNGLRSEHDRLSKEVEKANEQFARAKGDTKDADWKKVYGLSIDEDTVKDRRYENSGLSIIARNAKSKNVKYNGPVKRVHPRTEQQTIDVLAGGDKTSGSCVSLAFAYAANKAGYDVIDYRGGGSQAVFASHGRSATSALGALTKKGLQDIKLSHELLDTVEDGKEYVFMTGRHASVVKRENGNLQYLELQSFAQNGWKDLNDDVLRKRFKARDTRPYDRENVIIEIGELTKNEEFLSILGYINTAPGKQKKGAGGSEK